MQLDPTLHSARVRHQEEKGFVVQASRTKSVAPGLQEYPPPPPTSARTGEHCILYCFATIVVRSCLELFCFLSFVSFVLHHLYPGTHRRNCFFLGLYQIDKPYINTRKHKTLPGISFGSFACFLSKEILFLNPHLQPKLYIKLSFWLIIINK